MDSTEAALYSVPGELGAPADVGIVGWCCMVDRWGCVALGLGCILRPLSKPSPALGASQKSTTVHVSLEWSSIKGQFKIRGTLSC